MKTLLLAFAAVGLMATEAAAQIGGANPPPDGVRRPPARAQPQPGRPSAGQPPQAVPRSRAATPPPPPLARPVPMPVQPQQGWRGPPRQPPVVVAPPPPPSYRPPQRWRSPQPSYVPPPPVYQPAPYGYGAPSNWRHRRPFDWCQAKAQRLYEFEYRMQQDGRVSRDEARIARALRADLANSCGDGRWAPNRGWYY